MTNKKECIFSEEFQGWEFSESFLNKFFKTQNSNNFKSISSNFLNSKNFMDKIDFYYTLDKNSIFYNKKINQLPYFPIGIHNY